MPRPLLDLDPHWGIGAYWREHVLYSGVDGTTEAGQRHYAMNRHLYRGPDPAYPHGREKMFISFGCPVHYPSDCEYSRIMVPFSNPLDGGPPLAEGQGLNRDQYWTVVSGPASELTTLTLTPSIQMPSAEHGPEHWHGHIVDGQAIP